MKKKKQDYSIYINIIFVILIGFAGIFLYKICAGQNPVDIVQNVKTQNSENHSVQKPLPIVQAVKKEEVKKNIPPFQKYKYKYSYTLDVQGYIKNLDFKILMPSDENEKQYISDMNMSIKPSRIYNDGINTIAEYTFEDISTQKINIVFEGMANVRTYNINTAEIINKNISHEKDLNRYLQAEDLIESNDSYIKNIAEKITGTTKEEIVQNIYEYIQKNIEYKIINYNAGAKKALQQKYGKCSEYSAAMIALCRAKNIPARLVIGNITREQMTQHNWVEVWFDNYGWVAFDPTAQATVVNIYSPNGKLLKQEKRYDTSHNNLRYIASGRNKFSLCNMKYSVSGSKNGKVYLSEQIQIQKAD